MSGVDFVGDDKCNPIKSNLLNPIPWQPSHDAKGGAAAGKVKDQPKETKSEEGQGGKGDGGTEGATEGGSE